MGITMSFFNESYRFICWQINLSMFISIVFVISLSWLNLTVNISDFIIY